MPSRRRRGRLQPLPRAERASRARARALERRDETGAWQVAYYESISTPPMPLPPRPRISTPPMPLPPRRDQTAGGAPRDRSRTARERELARTRRLQRALKRKRGLGWQLLDAIAVSAAAAAAIHFGGCS